MRAGTHGCMWVHMGVDGCGGGAATLKHKNKQEKTRQNECAVYVSDICIHGRENFREKNMYVRTDMRIHVYMCLHMRHLMYQPLCMPARRGVRA